MLVINKYHPSDQPVVSATVHDPFNQKMRTQTKSFNSKHAIKYLLFRSVDTRRCAYTHSW